MKEHNISPKECWNLERAKIKFHKEHPGVFVAFQDYSEYIKSYCQISDKAKEFLQKTYDILDWDIISMWSTQQLNFYKKDSYFGAIIIENPDELIPPGIRYNCSDLGIEHKRVEMNKIKNASILDEIYALSIEYGYNKKEEVNE